MAGKAGFGTVFKVTIDSVLTPIAGLTGINGISLSSDTIDVSAHDSPDAYMEFEQGLIDGGTVDIEGNFYANASQTELKGVMEARTAVPMSITFPATLGSWTFNGFVTAFATEEPYDDKLSFSASIKVTGKPTLA